MQSGTYTINLKQKIAVVQNVRVIVIFTVLLAETGLICHRNLLLEIETIVKYNADISDTAKQFKWKVVYGLLMMSV